MTVTEERRSHTSIERRGWVPGYGPGMIIGALGALGVAVSLFLPWRDGGIHPSGVPVAFLWDRATGSSDPSLLIFLIPLAVVLVIGVVVPIGEAVRLFGAVGVLIVTGVFAYQLDRALAAFPGAGLGDVLDTGFYVAAIGGILAFVSALLPTGWSARREVTEVEAVRTEPEDDARVAPGA